MKKNTAVNFIKFSLMCFIFFSFIGFIPMPANAVEDPIIFQPQIGIPGFDKATPLTENNTSYIAKLIKAFYDYGLSIGGILAALVLMAGGLIWLTSGGSSDKITQAKGLMIGSITGLGLLFGAWIILNTINPYLLEFKIRDIKGVVAVFIADGDDGIIDGIGSLPKDAEIKYKCLGEDQTCSDTNPPSTQLDLSICINKLGGYTSNMCGTSAPLTQEACCATSDEINKEMAKQCINKPAGTYCKPTPTSGEKAGYCHDNKCDGAKVCCLCGQGCVGSHCIYASCRNDISAAECSSWCTNGWVGWSAYYYAGGSSNYTCTGGIKSNCEAASGTW